MLKRLPNGRIDHDCLDCQLTENLIENGSKIHGLGSFYGGKYKRKTARSEPANENWFEGRQVIELRPKPEKEPIILAPVIEEKQTFDFDELRTDADV